MKNKLTAIFILLLAATDWTVAEAADTDLRHLKYYLTLAKTFSEKSPREKVFVHIDNTSYFAGDKIWFQGYVVNGIDNSPTSISKTLYVELLNPRGKVIAKQILKVENGRCSGAFTLNHLPFYSGFYEIRAYTKYLLNFGETAIFSRTIPVFEQPKKAGDYADKRMTRNISKYTGPRPNPPKTPKLAMRFFPEGGYLTEGINSKVAFEITGHHGLPVECTGVVIDESTGEIVDSIITIHEGRGYFSITPEQKKVYTAVIHANNNNSEHRFKLPEPRFSGIGLSVDNITDPDSLSITITPGNNNSDTHTVGVAIISQGALWSYSFVSPSSARTIKLSTANMPSGVSGITLFGTDGRTMAERMIFINNGGIGQITAQLDKPTPKPHEKITLEIDAMDANGNPEQFLPLSVAVSDAENSVDYQGGLLAELLLLSDIKGYVRDPMQYFTDKSAANSRNLDLLLMVHGWRCYSWEEMSGLNPLEIKYTPEKAIDLDGKVVSFVRGIPKANTDISVLISQHTPADSVKQTFTDRISTDSCGKFTISYDLIGKWDMVTSVSEKGKSKDHRLILNRLFSPAPRKYDPQEMIITQYTSDDKKDSVHASIDSVGEDIEEAETIEQLDSTQSVKTTQLGEVVVSAKRNEKYLSRSKSVEYYDMQQELGNLADEGKVVSNNLFDILKVINPYFQRVFTANGERLYYKTKKPLFVINYKRTTLADSLNYTYLYPESIKAIYITEDDATKLRYADPIHYTMFNISAYSCAVLIETFDEPKGPAAKGTRLQMIEGYTVPEEYQNIDSEDWLDKPDLRRTLYWNPNLTTDSAGKAKVQFLNNSTASPLKISICGITDNGTIYSLTGSK